MFVDRAEIEVVAGDGGDGCMSFRRERHIPLGGPDGGDGGRGGDVTIIAKEGVNSLSALSHRRFWKAERGNHGQGADRHGKQGKSLIIAVPPGTIVRDVDGQFILKDLSTSDQQVVAARGGRGGRGNTHFKSSTNRAPQVRTRGEVGEVRKLALELKMIADVGLLGKPNAGKSTLLSRLSRARPEIADYPFTTKHPNLGLVQLNQDRSFVMADIPGLIEGAHEGVGLGHEFLRHVERTRVLIHLVEPSPMDGTDPVENYLAIRNELRQYDAPLAERPEIVTVTKAELPTAEETRRQLQEKCESPIHLISAVTGQGLSDMLREVVKTLDQTSD
jgi:GTP-binding protein